MSQALNIPVNSNLAMTGEMSLKGKVMAVGGIKEKVTAALRTGIDRIILPSENIPQFKQLGDIIKSKVNITFVSNVNDLMDAVFPTLSTQQDQNNITNQTTN
ncbi:Lon protease, mitochondrial [Thelohanellus kitauei]|uniref:Lon protease, mitochondrial n=1 Tax=Thelohanellus kitauei TaxID=669202 RepID=A0A0C2MZ24_THEKT|nr:Lon protease, mitochondrial [Thelohanellus kitauei]